MGIENIRIGAGRIYFGGVDLGLTQGGIDVQLETEEYEGNADQFGEIEAYSFITNRQITVTAPLLETHVENMVRTMPGATLVTDPNDPDRKRVDIRTGIGESLVDFSKELIIRSAINDLRVPVVKDEDFIIPVASTSGGLSFNHAHDAEKLLNVEFKAYPVAGSDIVARFGHPDAAAPLITSPAQGGIVNGDTATVDWDQNGNTDHANYRVTAGIIHGGTSYYDSGVLADTVVTQTINGLPEDGSVVWITLHYLQNGLWNSRAVSVVSQA